MLDGGLNLYDEGISLQQVEESAQKHSIAHLTSAHPRYDIRIFEKMCLSLCGKYAVSLVVADGIGNEEKNSVAIIDVGAKSGGRFSRMTTTVRRVYQKALELDAELYHLHDPELLPVAYLLKAKGKRVVFDAHEDLPVQVLSKRYIPLRLRKVISLAVGRFEAFICRRLDAVVAATPFIENKFKQYGCPVVSVCNFPLMSEFGEGAIQLGKREPKLVYVGGITKNRGITEIVSALHELDDVRLNLAGSFMSPDIEKTITSLPAWSKVDFLGQVGRQEVLGILSRSCAGLVTLHPIPNYKDSLPIKLFEYMAAGIPFIASNFPYWMELLQEYECGIFVDPEDPIGIKNAARLLIGNPRTSQEMGERGRQAFLKKYNWDVEEKKLLQLYEGLIV